MFSVVTAASTEVLTGSEAKLTCKATGLPSAGTFSWKAAGSDTVLNGVTGNLAGDEQSNVLTVSSPTADLAYTCTVANGDFTADASATLGVFGKTSNLGLGKFSSFKFQSI